MVRDAGDVVEIDGAVFLTSWAAVEEAGRHPEVFSSKRAFDSLGSPLPLVPIAVDPPDHVRYRRLLDPFFAPRRLAPLEPALREQLGAIVDGLVGRHRFDAIADLAVPYPSQVLPPGDRRRPAARGRIGPRADHRHLRPPRRPNGGVVLQHRPGR